MNWLNARGLTETELFHALVAFFGTHEEPDDTSPDAIKLLADMHTEAGDRGGTERLPMAFRKCGCGIWPTGGESLGELALPRTAMWPTRRHDPPPM